MGILSITACALDSLTTIYGLSLGGFIETNPLFYKLGMSFFYLKIILTSLLFLVSTVVYVKTKKNYVWTALLILTAAQFFFGISNVVTIFLSR